MSMLMKRGNQNWIPSIFNDFFNSDVLVRNNATAPAINVFETEKEYKVEVAAAGMRKEDFKTFVKLRSDSGVGALRSELLVAISKSIS